jgi:hypothetical protein
VFTCSWGFATHGCIDGFSRVITFVHCCLSNTGAAVASSFLRATQKYGLPARVRTDLGMENFHVAVIMNIIRGCNRSSVITGRSVHNQRIERLWRDVHKEAIHYFYNLFYSFEDEGILCTDDAIQIYALRLIFLPLINVALTEFQGAWNLHKIRTERNETPQQIWLNGMLENANSDNTVASELFDADGANVVQRLHSRLDQLHVLPPLDSLELSVDEEHALLSADEEIALLAIIAVQVTPKDQYIMSVPQIRAIIETRVEL